MNKRPAIAFVVGFVLAAFYAIAQPVTPGGGGATLTVTTANATTGNFGFADAGIVKATMVDAGYIAMGCGNLINLCPGETAGLYRSSANILSSAGDFAVASGRLFSRNANGGFSFGIAGTEFFGMNAGSNTVGIGGGGILQVGSSQATTETFKIGGRTMIVNSTPTVSGFGTSPSVVANSGSVVFIINVGTGGSASTGTVTFAQAATTGWVCDCQDVTTPANGITKQTGGTTTTCTFTNYDWAGSPVAWAASDVLRCTAFGY